MKYYPRCNKPRVVGELSVEDASLYNVDRGARFISAVTNTEQNSENS